MADTYIRLSLQQAHRFAGTRPRLKSPLRENPDPDKLRAQLSNPAVRTKLPFPFVGDHLPTDRFKLTPDADWSYAGRERFTELLDMAPSLKGSFQNGCMGRLGTAIY